MAKCIYKKLFEKSLGKLSNLQNALAPLRRGHFVKMFQLRKIFQNIRYRTLYFSQKIKRFQSLSNEARSGI
jgi:hypothetical protein